MYLRVNYYVSPHNPNLKASKIIKNNVNRVVKAKVPSSSGRQVTVVGTRIPATATVTRTASSPSPSLARLRVATNHGTWKNAAQRLLQLTPLVHQATTKALLR